MQNATRCERDQECYEAVARHRFVWAAEEDIVDVAVSHPGEYTAAVVFDIPSSETAPISGFTLQVCARCINVSFCTCFVGAHDVLHTC
jgi:hypothetical protein